MGNRGEPRQKEAGERPPEPGSAHAQSGGDLPACGQARGRGRALPQGAQHCCEEAYLHRAAGEGLPRAVADLAVAGAGVPEAAAVAARAKVHRQQ